MTRLQIRPIPHAANGLIYLMQRAPDESLPVHDVMRVMIRHLFDRNFTDRDALLALQDMLRPDLSNADGLSKLAMEFSRLLAVLEETYHYQLRTRIKSQMAALYVPLGPDYAVLTNPSEVLMSLDTLRGMGKTLADNELVYRVEVPAGFNQLTAAGARGADTLLQETIAAIHSGKRLPTASERGYMDKEAQVYDEAVTEIYLTLMHNYFNLVKPGWYDYRVEYPGDWEAIIIYSRKQAKLELVKSETDPDEKEPA